MRCWGTNQAGAFWALAIWEIPVYSTCADATVDQVIGQYASRWSIEVAYLAVKLRLGFEQPQGWCQKTVERIAPMAMLIYTLVIVWFAREGHRHWRPAGHARYPSKRDPSFADMLVELKRRSIRGYIVSLPLDAMGPRKPSHSEKHGQPSRVNCKARRRRASVKVLLAWDMFD